MEIKDALSKLKALKEHRDAAKEVFSQAENEFKQFQTEVWDFMDENKIDGMKVDGVNFVKTATAYASVQDRDEFREWAKENDESLIELKERSALLNALVRERLDNEEELPPGVGMYVREVISQRAAD